MGKVQFKSAKLFDGYSTVFRQWKAAGTHCRFLHGYGVSFEVVFEGELDERNWVFDFGGMKRAKAKIDGMNPKDFFDHMFDHTVILAADDPELEAFKALHDRNVIQLRILPQVGCEMFAAFILDKVNAFLKEETAGRVRATSVKFMEHAKNYSVATL